MRKFRFPLEGVARVRELAVRRREVTLARAREELARAEEQRRLDAEAIRQSLRSAPRGSVVQVRQLLERDRELQRLRARLARQEEVLAEREAGMADERSRLLEARRDAKAVEKLRERRYVEFVREVVREEQKGTDEVASNRARQKRTA
jgi:flagellar FliJ protein